jgi:quinol monooxygenase YgiN
MIIQVVRASIKPAARDLWLEVVRQNAIKTRSAEGCESYQIGEDLEVPNTFIILEHWTDLNAIHSHFRNQFKDLMALLGDVFAAPPQASFYEVTSTRTLAEVLAAAGVAP